MSYKEQGSTPTPSLGLRTSADEQLIDQARDLLRRASKSSDIADEGRWVAQHGWQEPPGSDYWHVTATRSPRKAEPYAVTKALTRDPDVAALLTFMSTALPRLCDLADAALLDAARAEGAASLGLSEENRALAALDRLVDFAEGRYPYSEDGSASEDFATVRAAITPSKPTLGEGEWRPIETAPKDGTVIWAVFRGDLERLREDLSRWNNVQVPLRHEGRTPSDYDLGWSIRAPVGHGGFPDAWLAGWKPLPEPPAKPTTSAEREGGGAGTQNPSPTPRNSGGRG